MKLVKFTDIIMVSAIFLTPAFSRANSNPVVDAVSRLLGGAPTTPGSVLPLVEVSIYTDGDAGHIGYGVSCKMRDGGIFQNSCAGGGFTSGNYWIDISGPTFYPNSPVKLNMSFLGEEAKKFNQCHTTGGSVINFHNKSVAEQIPIDGTAFSLSYASNYNDLDPANRNLIVSSPFTYNETLPPFDLVVFESSNGVSMTLNYHSDQFYDELQIPKGKLDDIFSYHWDGLTGNSSSNIFVSKLNFSVGFASRLTNDSVGVVLDQGRLYLNGLLGDFAALYGFSKDQLYLDAKVSYFVGDQFIGSTSNFGEPVWLPVANSPVGEIARTQKVFSIYHPRVWGMAGWTIDIHHYLDLSTKTLYRGDGSIDTYERILGYVDPLTGQTVYYVPDKNNKENYFVFDGQGKHLYTRHMFWYDKYIYKFSYDSSYNLLGIEDFHGNLTQFTREGDKVVITAPFGQQTKLQLENDNLLYVENSLQKKHEMTYDNLSRLASFKDLSGEATELLYGSDGKFYAESKNTGILQNIAKTVANGLQTLQVNMGWGQKIKQVISKLNDEEITKEFDAAGTILATTRRFNGDDTEVSKTNEVTTVSYQDSPIWGKDVKELKRIDSVRTSSSLGTTSQNLIFAGDTNIAMLGNYPPFYRSFDRYHYFPNTNAYHEEFRVDLDRRVVLRQDGNPDVVIMNLNEDGQVNAIQRTNQRTVNFEYNSRGQLAKKIVENTYENYTYDSFGFLDSITNSLGQITRFQNDPQGKLLVKTLPNGDQIKFEYTDAGELKKIITPSNQSHYFQYDLGDYINSYLSPGGGTSYRYDEHKRISRIVKPSGKEINYVYQAGFNRLSEISTPSGNYIFSNFNSSGRPGVVSSPDNISTELGYFGEDLQLQKWVDEDGSEIGSVALKYHESLPVINQILINGSVMANLTYRANLTLSNINELGINQNASQVDFGINGIFGTYSHTSDNNSFVSIYAGENIINIGRNFDNFAIARGYTQHTITNGQYSSYSLQKPVYDENNRLVKIQRESKGYVNGQLVGNQDYENQYIYPQHSNNNMTEFRQVISDPASPAKRTLATYSNDDRLLNLRGSVQRDYSYDDDGNLSRMSNCYGNTDYVYDAFGNLKKVVLPDGKVIEYKVDAFNRRVKKLVNGQVVEYYLWYNRTKIAAILNGDKSVKLLYFYSPESEGPSLIVKNGVTYKVFEDPGLASVRFVINTVSKAIVQELDYDEYGNFLNNKNPEFQPVMYSGGLYDFDTKLYRFGDRDYDPTIGRWTAKDPIGFAGGDANLYAYVGGNPMSYNDPTGNCPWCIAAAVGGLVSGGIDLGVQLAGNGGNFSNVDWGSVGTSAAIGAATSALMPTGFLLGRGGARAAAQGYNTTAGLLNQGNTRIGWSFLNEAGKDVLSLRVGKTHYDLLRSGLKAGANPLRDGLYSGIIVGGMRNGQNVCPLQ